jgi:hypothetical protein
LAVLELGAIAFLRGRVGPDTSAYEWMAAHISGVHNVEPLFRGLLSLLVDVFDSPLHAVTMGLSGILILLLLIYIRQADENTTFLLQAFYIPVAFFVQSTNMIRFGIAFALLLFFTRCVTIRYYKTAFLLAIVATLTHYSAAVFIVLWLLTTLEYRLTIPRVVGGVICLLSIGALVFYAQTHLLLKYSLYIESENRAPAWYSGLAPIAVTLTVLLGVTMGALRSTAKARIILIGLLWLTGCWILTQYSYSGLRMTNIGELVVPYAALALYQQQHMRFEPRLKAFILAAGLIGACFVYRNMLDDRMVSHLKSPSLPYTFFWDDM